MPLASDMKEDISAKNAPSGCSIDWYEPARPRYVVYIALILLNVRRFIPGSDVGSNGDQGVATAVVNHRDDLNVPV